MRNLGARLMMILMSKGPVPGLTTLANLKRVFTRGLDLLLPSPHQRDLLNLLRIEQAKKHSHGSKVLLVELSVSCDAEWVLGLRGLCEYIRKDRAVEFRGYTPAVSLNPLIPRLFVRGRDFLLWFLPLSPAARIYRRLGIRPGVSDCGSLAHQREARQLFERLMQETDSKASVRAWAVDGVVVGDLLYDHFLRAYRRGTLALRSKEFQRFATRFLESALFWRDYFRKSEISGVITRNTEYGPGLPLRFSAYHGSLAFVPSVYSIKSLAGSHDNARRIETEALRSDFLSAAPELQEEARFLARAWMRSRFEGDVDPAIWYADSNPYSSGRLKAEMGLDSTSVVIFSHRVWDAANLYGSSLFADLLAWLDFLGRLSQESEFSWFVKDHPSADSSDLAAVSDFIDRYPNIRRLPGDSDNLELVRSKIRLGLTVFGTVGYELPHFGVPIICASPFTPYRNWSFASHPASIDEYVAAIKSPPKPKPHDKSEALEFVAALVMRRVLFGHIFRPPRPSPSRTGFVGVHPSNEELLRETKEHGMTSMTPKMAKALDRVLAMTEGPNWTATPATFEAFKEEVRVYPED